MRSRLFYIDLVFLTVLTIALCVGIAYFIYDKSTPEVKTHYAPFILIPLCFLCVATGVVAFFSNRSSKNKGGVAYALILAIILSILSFATFYRITGLNKGSEFIKHPDPIDCLYFSVVTWTTLGYGDFTPSDDAKYIAMLEAILGYVAMSLLIAVFIKFLDNRPVR